MIHLHVGLNPVNKSLNEEKYKYKVSRDIQKLSKKHMCDLVSRNLQLQHASRWKDKTLQFVIFQTKFQVL